MHSVLRQWKELYEADKEKAVTMIVNFVLQVIDHLVFLSSFHSFLSF